jgi:hypothetical protein
MHVRPMESRDVEAAFAVSAAAFDDAAAATMPHGCFAAMDGEEASVRWVTSAQNWAIAPCVEAGLELRSDGGAVFLAGDVGPFAPYLPSGAYL